MATRLSNGTFVGDDGIIRDGEGGLQDPDWCYCEYGHLIHIDDVYYSHRGGYAVCHKHMRMEEKEDGLDG